MTRKAATFRSYVLLLSILVGGIGPTALAADDGSKTWSQFGVFFGSARAAGALVL